MNQYTQRELQFDEGTKPHIRNHHVKANYRELKRKDWNFRKRILSVDGATAAMTELKEEKKGLI